MRAIRKYFFNTEFWSNVMLRKICVGLMTMVPLSIFAESAPSISYIEYADNTWKKIDPSQLSEDDLTSRYILNSDPKITSLANVPLRGTWWSRYHEYAWVVQFAGPELRVLDGACGVSHPFKWFLGKSCKETYACDIDSRLDSKEKIIQETYDDLGPIAHEVVSNDEEIWDKVKLSNDSIHNLPDHFPKFDRIFCISTFEDLDLNDRQSTLNSFAKHLEDDGLIVITCDCPKVSVEELWKAAENAGLVPAGKVEKDIPADALHHDRWGIYIYRCVLKLAPKQDELTQNIVENIDTSELS